MEQEHNTLLSRVINRVLNKEHSPKAFKRLASLVLAGAIGLSLSACNVSNAIDGSSKDSSTKYEDSSNIDSSDSSSVEEPPIEVDYSKFSPIIQAMFNNDYYVALTQKIQENVANGDYADYYSHPTMFWDSVGIDANKIRSGEIECQTNAFVYDEEPNNLYIATYITDTNNDCYDQYLIKYTLTDQEMKEYYTLRELKVWQNFYMNDILSIYKKPEIVKHGKINIETYDMLKQSFNNNLIVNSFMDSVYTIAGEEDGKPVFTVTSFHDKSILPYQPNEETWGIPNSIFEVREIRHLTFNDDVDCSIKNGILYIDPASVKNPKNVFYTLSEDDKNAKFDRHATQYCRQDLCCELLPHMYSELKPEHLAEFLEKINEKTENN